MMKTFFIKVLFLCFIVTTFYAQAGEEDKPLKLYCKDFTWGDIGELVSPYLDDNLYTALVMQGQSSNYKISTAASEAINNTQPDAIKRILQALIDADC